MTEREYLEALSEGMQRLVAEAEEQVERQAEPFPTEQWAADQRTKSLALLDSLQPPAELADLHARLRSAAERSPATPGETEQIEDLLELARRMELYGLQLMPGVTADNIEQEMRFPPGERFIVSDDTGDWEQKLRHALKEDGHPDIEGVVERMRKLREK